MDSYQAIYDAVRSRISGGDIGEAVESAMRDANISFYADRVSMAYQEAANEQLNPSVLYKPALSVDGDQWCALYGENLQEGVSGFGNSPAEAMEDFNKAWYAKLPEIGKPKKELPSKTCTMNCGRSATDTRTWEEIKSTCEDCRINQ